MADPSRPLTAPDDNYNYDFALSPRAFLSSPREVSPSPRYSPLALLRNSNGYQPMSSNAPHEMDDLFDSPVVGGSGLGTSSSPWLNDHKPTSQPPVQSTTNPLDTSKSSPQRLLETSASPPASPSASPSAPVSPPVGLSSGHSPNTYPPSSSDTPEPFSEIWMPSIPVSNQSPNADTPVKSGVLKTVPESQERELDFSEVDSAGRAAPGSSNPRADAMDDDYDDDAFYRKFAEPPSYCSSRRDIHQSRKSWLSITIYVLSLYSTILSGIWLVVAILQPRWGHSISSRRGLSPSTATTVAALLAKTIEMSFVTVFISCLGQVLTRRAFIRKAQGMTLAEMTMRNWVIQPGSLITHFETLPSSFMTLLGALSLTATFAASFYTTASDAMVSPKLKFGGWESRELSGIVHASYANAQYVSHDCASLFDLEADIHAAESCMNVQFSGQSYRNLLNFMTTWTDLHVNSTSVVNDLSKRPTGNTLLFDNTTMTSAWIETEHSNVTAQHEETGWIINNVTLAMPHPGVYGAATLRDNDILQPDDLAGVGEYAVRAGVVSPSINVLCVSLDKDELSPLVYTEWPNSEVNRTDVGDQVRGWEGWEGQVPPPVDDDGKDEYLNRTDIDDIFKWGPEYKRRPPVFQLYPNDYNLLTNATVTGSDAIYMLGKPAESRNYTLCQIRSWVSPNCSTEFNISGTGGANMKAHCEDPDDENSYLRSFDTDQGWAPPSLDWRWLADQWRLSMDLNGGSVNNNASNARILTQLALQEPKLPSSLPSMAEAIAVYASSLVVISSIDTPFVHYWDLDVEGNMIIDGPGLLQPFNASISTQQYTSGHTQDWQNIFYVVLVLVFAINFFCLCYFIMRSGMVTDFTEPQNLFALAVNSPPSGMLTGSCGGGPEKNHLVVPWRVAYAQSANHYFFEETLGDGENVSLAVTTAREMGGTARTATYKRLSSSKGWL